MHLNYCAPEGEEFQQRLLSGPSADFCPGIYRKSKILSIDGDLKEFPATSSNQALERLAPSKKKSE